MTLNMAQASSVMWQVLDVYGSELPGGLADKVRSLSPSKIFHLLGHDNYVPHFDAYFRSWFAPTNTVVFGLEDIYDYLRTGEHFACPAFCSPAVDPTGRRIYVNLGAGNTKGTLYHEFVHFLSHGNFYPELYALGGQSPVLLEGATEYLTREINGSIAADRKKQGKYQKALETVTNKCGGRNDKTTAMLCKLVFQGDLSIAAKLGFAVPRL